MATQESISERMRVGPARMGVWPRRWPDGEPGIRLRIGENEFQFTIEGATRLKDALEYQIKEARHEE